MVESVRPARDNIIGVLIGGVWHEVFPGTFTGDENIGGFAFIDEDWEATRITGRYADIQAFRELRT